MSDHSVALSCAALSPVGPQTAEPRPPASPQFTASRFRASPHSTPPRAHAGQAWTPPPASWSSCSVSLGPSPACLLPRAFLPRQSLSTPHPAPHTRPARSPRAAQPRSPAGTYNGTCGQEAKIQPGCHRPSPRGPSSLPVSSPPKRPELGWRPCTARGEPHTVPLPVLIPPPGVPFPTSLLLTPTHPTEQRPRLRPRGPQQLWPPLSSCVNGNSEIFLRVWESPHSRPQPLQRLGGGGTTDS